MLHFYPTPKNGGPKHDFLVLLNVLVGVHETIKNLLNCIGVRDLVFCDIFFTIFILYLFIKSSGFQRYKKKKKLFKITCLRYILLLIFILRT